MKKNILLLFALFLIVYFNSYSQHTFDTYFNSTENQAAYNVVENEDGSFLISGTRVENGTTTSALLMKLSSEGDSIFTAFQFEEGFYQSFYHIFSVNNLYYVIGTKVQGGTNLPSSITMSVYSSNLTLIASFIYPPLIDTNILYLAAILDSDTNIVISGFTVGETDADSFILKINLEGNIVINKIIDYPYTKIYYKLFESPDNSCYYQFGIYNDITEDEIVVTTYNKELDSLSSQIVDNLFFFYYYPEWLNDSTLIVSSTGLEHEIIATSMSDSFDITHQHSFKLGDYDEYPCFRDGVSIKDGNIYMGSITNYIISDFWPNEDNWFHLIKLDQYMQPIWQKWYGQEAYHFLHSIHATNDGGCIMVGDRYDYKIGIHERDIYVVKVDEDGLITWEKEILFPTQKAFVYPNPGKEKLILSSMVLAADFQLTDLQGKVILQQIIQNNITEINTQTISLGTYLWTLTKEGRIVESGKWVKN